MTHSIALVLATIVAAAACTSEPISDRAASVAAESADSSPEGVDLQELLAATPDAAPGAFLFVANLMAEHSHKCMNVDHASLDDRARIIQYPCNSDFNELFDVYQGNSSNTIVLKSVRSDKCVDVAEASPEDRAPVIQYTCMTANGLFTGLNQTFIVNNGALSPLSAGSKCLDVEGASTADHAGIIQYRCTGADNQRWRALR